MGESGAALSSGTCSYCSYSLKCLEVEFSELYFSGYCIERPLKATNSSLLGASAPAERFL